VLLVPVGATEAEHGGFAGALSIGQRAIELLLVELCRSASDTFRRVVLVSTHAGDMEPLQRALAALRGEGRDVRAEAGDPRPLDQVISALRADGILAVSRSGVLGDPTDADPEHRHALLDAATEALVSQLEGWS
jgi:creatinine amidohydrolase